MNEIIELFKGSPWKCEILKTMLGDAGIESFIRNEMSVRYVPQPFEDLPLMINSADKEKAAAILEEFLSNEAASTEK